MIGPLHPSSSPRPLLSCLVLRELAKGEKPCMTRGDTCNVLKARGADRKNLCRQAASLYITDSVPALCRLQEPAFLRVYWSWSHLSEPSSLCAFIPSTSYLYPTHPLWFPEQPCLLTPCLHHSVSGRCQRALLSHQVSMCRPSHLRSPCSPSVQEP